MMELVYRVGAVLRRNLLPAPPSPAEPKTTPLYGGELTRLQVVALPDAVMLLGAGRHAHLYAELSVSDAVRLRCDLDDALQVALDTGPSRRERQLFTARPLDPA